MEQQTKTPDELAIIQWEGSKLRPIVETHTKHILSSAGENMRAIVEQSTASFASALRRLLVTNPVMFREIGVKNPASVRDALEYVCTLGLRVGQGYDAQVWPIPRTLKGVPTLCVQIGTRGLQALADRAGWRVKAISVSVQDVEEGRLILQDAEVRFNRNPMSEPLEGWAEAAAAWDNLAGFVVFAGRHGLPMTDGHWVPKGVIARRRAMSQQANGNFWKQWPIEMARGVAIRDTCKQIGGDTDLGLKMQQIANYEGAYLRGEDAQQDPMHSLRAAIAQPPTIDVVDAPVETVRRPETVQAPQDESPEDRYNREQDELFARQNPPSGK